MTVARQAVQSSKEENAGKPGDLATLRKTAAECAAILKRSPHHCAESRLGSVWLLAADKNETKKVAQKYEKTIWMKYDAMREFHLVCRAVEARAFKHTMAMPKELDAHMMGIWDEFSARCNERVERLFQPGRHVALESHILQSRLHVGDDPDLYIATVVLHDAHDDISARCSSSAIAGTSGGGRVHDAILPDDDDNDELLDA